MPFSSVSRGDLRRLALVAADDVMGARERAFRIGRIGGGDAALEDAGQELADAAARIGVVAVLRHEDEHRDEAVELVARASARTRGRSDRFMMSRAKSVERVLVDLEQFVARIVFENVAQRAARIARRVEARARDDLLDLVAQIRHFAGGVGVGARGEQPDDAQFALSRPSPSNSLTPT